LPGNAHVPDPPQTVSFHALETGVRALKTEIYGLWVRLRIPSHSTMIWNVVLDRVVTKVTSMNRTD